MARFIDEYPPAEMKSFGWISSPMFSTQITQSDSGAEQANRRWLHPLRRFISPDAIREHDVFEAVKAHWLVMGGPAHTWPIRDPTDFASAELEAMNVAPALARTDQLLGVGNGARTQFQLVKTYARGSQQYVRPIHLPVTSSVLIGLNGADPASLSPAVSWSVSRYGGVVTFATPPANGVNVTAGFLFDCEVRFESDDTFEGVVKSYRVAGFADIPLVEVRAC